MTKGINLETGSNFKTPGGGISSHHPSCYWRFLFPAIGVLIVILGNLPFFILKGSSVISVREQLDGELVGYMLGAKYLFNATDIYPEFLGGVLKSALTPPSYGSLIFYKLFPPLTAFLANQLLVMLAGFIGMYLWGVKLTGKRFISFAGGILFAFLPYYTVYGLSVSGVPLVAWALYVLAEYGRKDVSPEEQKKFGLLPVISAFLAIAVYGLFSSLVLCGYAVCACAVLALFIILIRKKSGLSVSGKLLMAAGTAELIIIYLLLNLDLIRQILKPGSGYISHKTEIVQGYSPFIQSFTELLSKGSIAVPSLHLFIFFGTIAVLTVSLGLLISRKIKGKKTEKAELFRYSKILFLFFAAAVFIAVFYGIFHTEKAAKAISSSDSVLKAFQIDRFYWLYPFIWYTALILIGAICSELVKKKWITYILLSVILIPCALYVLKESAFKENAMEFVRKNSTALTWDAFFSENEFSEIAEYIEEKTGLSQDAYRVGSIGIEPSVSFYNGFYTIDGYSNNYSLEYKLRFRKAIEKELEKNDYNRDYFDNWGNRCYLFSSEYYGNPLLTKYEHAYFSDLELNTEALRDLGCRYIFAAGEIAGAEEKGLRLEKIFDDYGYTYVVYLYEVV